MKKNIVYAFMLLAFCIPHIDATGLGEFITSYIVYTKTQEQLKKKLENCKKTCSSKNIFDMKTCLALCIEKYKKRQKN